MPDPVPVIVPQANPNDDHAVLIRWHVPSGARVARGQTLVTLETTKAAFDVEAPCAGFAFFDTAPRTLCAVGARIAWIADEPVPPRVPASEESVAPNAPDGEQRFTRKALRLMRQHGLAPADFPGTDKVGEAEVDRLARARPQATGAHPARPGVGAVEQPPEKLLEIARLTEIYREAIPSNVSVSVSVERIGQRQQRLAAEIGAISLLELIVHDAARLLGAYPYFNGYHADGKAWRHDTVGIGFAVNLGKGLRVPVVRGAAELSLLEIARKVRDLSLRYMRGELTVEDVSGGTFTVTDLSAQGVVHFTPVLNRQQAAILGICAERPGSGYRDLVLTFDHRMADGMQAASFLGELKARLEETPANRE